MLFSKNILNSEKTEKLLFNRVEVILDEVKDIEGNVFYICEDVDGDYLIIVVETISGGHYNDYDEKQVRSQFEGVLDWFITNQLEGSRTINFQLWTVSLSEDQHQAVLRVWTL